MLQVFPFRGMYFPRFLNCLPASTLHLVYQFVPGFVVWKRFSHLVKDLVQVVWDWYFGQLCPMTMDRNIVCSSIHLVPVLPTNPGSRRNPPRPSQNFSSSPERSRITSIVFFFSSFFFFYTPLVVRFRRHASCD